MIMLVDDERRRVDSYLAELEFSGYSVHLESDVDSAWSFFLNNIDDVELLILDVAMPHGSTFTDGETERGFRTGVKLYQKVRERSPAHRVMMLTNFARELSDSMMQDSKCWLFSKGDLLPFELVEEVKRILG